MTKSFEDALADLEARTCQILSYHQVSPDAIPRNELVAHFTSWEACCAIFDAAIERLNGAGADPPRNTDEMSEASEPAEPPRGLSLWASDASCLNDPLEGKALRMFAHKAQTARTPRPHHVTGRWPPPVSGEEADGPYLKPAEWASLNRTLAKIDPDAPPQPAGTVAPVFLSTGVAYLVSFCREADRLDLWRTYADKATGVCLAMPLAQAVRQFPAEDWGFYRVAYDARSKTRALVLLKQPLEACTRFLNGNRKATRARMVSQILHRLGPLPYVFKHEQFQSEREIRLIPRKPDVDVKTAGQERRVVVGTPYRFLGPPGSVVMLGPRCPDRNIRAAVLGAWLKMLFGNRAPSVTHSEVPYQ